MPIFFSWQQGALIFDHQSQAGAGWSRSFLISVCERGFSVVIALFIAFCCGSFSRGGLLC